MDENDRHGAFEHAGRERAEEQHGSKHHPAGHFPVLKDVLYLRHDRFGVAGDYESYVTTQRRHKGRFVENMRQHEKQKCKKGYDRQENVIGQGA
jgi:hypothetical protein